MSSRAQAIADLPEEKFEAHVAAVKQRGQELANASVRRLATEKKEEGR